MYNKIFQPYISIGKEELKEATKVIRSGNLSGYVADNSNKFFGGRVVKKFENFLEKFYNVKYAITVNSWTSGLICMVGALDIEPGDEIIVTPWTMSATVASILHWNCIPVFADIDPNTFCINPDDVKRKITKRTKAIFAVDIFGRSSDVQQLKKICKNRNLKILIDGAQSPYCITKKGLAGTIGDIGGFSLNTHKIINSGEGGIIVTNNNKLAKRMRLLRNHAEVTNKFSKKKDLANMIGFNFRMGEIEAAIGIAQYKKIKNLLYKRQKLLNLLTKNLINLKGLILPPVEKKFQNNFYIYPIKLENNKIKINREKIIQLLKKEGVQHICKGYANLHLLRAFQKKIAFGTKGFPWNLNKKKIIYKKGICPVAENLQDKTFFMIEVCLFELNEKNIRFLIKSFKNVWKKLSLIN